MSLPLYFLSPVHLRRGSDRAALVGTWHPVRLNHNIHQPAFLLTRQPLAHPSPSPSVGWGGEMDKRKISCAEIKTV